MEDEVVVAEHLLQVRSRVTLGSTLGYLDKIWKPFGAGAADDGNASDNSNDESQQRMSSTQIANCNRESSAWILRKTPPITDFFQIGKKLGNPGQYGTVKQAIRLNDGQEFAAKIMGKHRFRDKKIKRRFFADIRDEVYLLHQASDHPNIVELSSVFEDIENVYLIMACCYGGELFDYIQNLSEQTQEQTQPKPQSGADSGSAAGSSVSDELNSNSKNNKNESGGGFSELHASQLFRQMVSAIYYTHSLGIAHCDLKPENFLFSGSAHAHNNNKKVQNKNGKNSKNSNSNTQTQTPAQTPSPNRLCLIDFGMAKVVQWRKYYKRMNGTPYYIAPEVLAGHYNESCDMWSLGVILFIMVFGYPPFFDENEAENTRTKSDEIIYAKIAKGFTPKVKLNYGPWFPSEIPISTECRDLISRLLRTNVADRMTAEEAIEHPWVKQSQHCQKNIGRRGSGCATNMHNHKSKDSKNSHMYLKRIVNPSIMHSLQGYRNHSQLQSEILKLLRECNYLNSSQMKSVSEFFEKADVNGDGKISADELYAALSKIDAHITKADTQSILSALDSNNDGYMDYEELLSSRINRKLQSKEERLRKVFKALDLDRSGKISADELKAALESINQESKIARHKCQQLIQSADLNQDGEIDFEEFVSMFRSQLT